MTASLAVVLLPGPGAIATTYASVRAEVGEHVPVRWLIREDDGSPPSPMVSDLPAGIERATAQELLATAEVLAFARAGDRWRPGTLAARRRPLSAHPTAVLGVAGYALVDRTGRELLVRRAPLPTVDPVEQLLCSAIEPSATLVRSAALDARSLALIAEPHGDAVVWSELVRRHGLLPSMEIAADVALDPDRHGHEPRARTESLLAGIRADAAPSDALGSTTLRRELLRRLYIEPQLAPELAGIELASLFATDTDADVRATIDDLQWTLERQHDALAAERLRWGSGEVDPSDRVMPGTDLELLDTRLKLEELWRELKVRDAEIVRMKAELAAEQDGNSVAG